jgi:DMSO/TMAO reductase YedYZ molybdopterin-dependent catalytic subunit
MSKPPLDRLPPGQIATRSFPVLHVGEAPPFDPKVWDLRIQGLVERPLRFTWEEFRALPRAVRKSDLHCVAGWSRLDNHWEGIVLRDLLGRAGPRHEARFVRFTDGRLYDTTIPLDLGDEDVILADMHDGRPLSSEHGGPLRAVVPGRYAWKSCKWLRTVELVAADKLGFWEVRGFRSGADPWKEERSG